MNCKWNRYECPYNGTAGCLYNGGCIYDNNYQNVATYTTGNANLIEIISLLKQILEEIKTRRSK